MAKLRVARDVLERARMRSNLTDDDRTRLERLLSGGRESNTITADVDAFPLAFLKALLDEPRLTPNQRAIVSVRVHGMTGPRGSHAEIYQTPVDSPIDFGTTFTRLGARSPNCEMFLGGRWYPVILNVQFPEDKGELLLPRGVLLLGWLSLCEFTYQVVRHVSPGFFADEEGNRQERTVEDVLNHHGFRRLQTSAAEHNLKLLRAERTARAGGQVVLVSAPVVEFSTYFWWSGFQPRALGTPEAPRRAVVEPELEIAERLRGHNALLGQVREGCSRLPFVRLFSLDTKSYVYADVDDVAPYEFDEGAMSRLYLPREMLTVLDRVFHTPVQSLFGDLIKGKHGGVVILAAGRPGVGKTLTAEVYAEETRRPLYVLELGELGTNVQQVEQNLHKVFLRVARWNAVLQFDECEIFLARRGEDLERSAIVGSFLRLLDYYQGILFLTTNRARGARPRGAEPGDADAGVPRPGPRGPGGGVADDVRGGGAGADRRDGGGAGRGRAERPSDPQPDAAGQGPPPRRPGHAGPDARGAALQPHRRGIVARRSAAVFVFLPSVPALRDEDQSPDR
jgi:ATPase family associated with various cellular activities (AAA)